MSKVTDYKLSTEGNQQTKILTLQSSDLQLNNN